ncbi:uncharacterized protein [Henckelia pumila]|uniref:uncharacterized protein n=1 Tax=Henckelia pumila TaxID=405737 RepID=UPI003C6E2280
MVENEPPRINNSDGEANNSAVYRSMMDCGIPTIEDVRSSIVRPTVTANQYEIKPAIIQMIQNTVQFGGSTIDDPNAHIENFLDSLHLFPFSLRDKAKSWLNSLPAGSIITWEDLAKAFLTKYFPPSKSMKLRTDIIMFAEGEQESLYEAWERYKDMLRQCPHHQLPDWIVVQAFYYGLLSANRTMLDAAAGGNLLRKSPEDGYELFEEMASSSYQPQPERSMMRKSAGIHQLDAFTSMTAQLEAMNKNIDGFSLGTSSMRIQEVFYDRFQGEHFTKDCQTGNPFYVPDEAPVNHVGSKNRPGQLAKRMSNREPGTLPSDTQNNPKEQVKAVELRSGMKPETKALEHEEKKNEALKKVKLDSQFSKFLEVFKKLHIIIPFADALLQMPSYATFLKKILTSKRKIEEHAMVNLTENCSSLVQNKIPPKLNDTGSFSIPCMIGDVVFHKALCDLGVSINLMPFSVFKKLGMGEPKPTRVFLQLADRSIKYPRGIIEDVLVKVDKFIFPVDFVVLDMEEDLDMPLILGRPSLET